jgi:hypothetical protein
MPLPRELAGPENVDMPFVPPESALEQVEVAPSGPAYAAHALSKELPLDLAPFPFELAEELPEDGCSYVLRAVGRVLVCASFSAGG